MSERLSPIQIEPLGDAAILVRGPQRIDAALNRIVQSLASALRDAPIDGVIDIVPSYASLALIVDPRWLARQDEDGIAALTAQVRQRIDLLASLSASSARHVLIPVCYGGDFGIDLDAVAAQAQLQSEEVVNRHLAVEYRVAFVGFQPGFPYLLGLDEKLALPRREVPRVRVPAGSVAIGGAQSGIYPRESPGGWHLIGRTSAVLFDEQSEAPALLNPGDAVSFYRVRADQLAAAAVKVPSR